MFRFNRNYELIKRYDSQAAEVYKDRYHCLTFAEIARLRGMSLSNVAELHKRAKYILEHTDELWTEGLSRRSRQALLRNGYRSIDQVRNDLDKLHTKPSIGEQIICEIRRWLIV